VAAVTLRFQRGLWVLLGLLALVVVGVAGWLRTDAGHAAASYLWIKLRGGYTVDDRVRMHAGDVEARLRAHFEAAAVPYPPPELAYVAYKDVAQLHVYARSDPAAAWRWIKTYPIQGMSGGPGPKLREGDRQVPEGLYRSSFLNANSRFHLSIRLDYPNDFDRAQGAADGRTALGSDIMIHGTDSSIGCLAMGNQAAEDLFILAAQVPQQRVDIIVAPTDLRRITPTHPVGSPPWLSELYSRIRDALDRFPDPA
jgi:hypothetical protein